MIETVEYVEKVYAGVLGKIIGVYLGRPFEGWTYERISAELGEIWYYVHEKLDKMLVVVDDDISGTFAFIRALEEFPEKGIDITSAEIGNTWLNNLIENQSILWWGGKGISTEHTAYLRLKEGYTAPESGSIGLNGKTVAEQIGAQIFIEGWGLVVPEDPERAVKLAREAGSVSHDGESVVAAQMIAAMVSLAFSADFAPAAGDNSSRKAIALVERATQYIDPDSFIRRIADDLLERREKEDDWRAVRSHIAGIYGYDKYRGGCHVVPNHAVDLLGLLYSDDNFQRGLMITNTSGWDTDCNSANVGCILGVMGGVEGIDNGADFRGPVADRMYVTTAEGGSVITDAVQETYRIVNSSRRLSGKPPSALDKQSRFNFSLPGSIQGFETDPDCNTPMGLSNAVIGNRRGLMIGFKNLSPSSHGHVRTVTFTPLDALSMDGYKLDACPTLYPGQTITASLAGVEGDAVYACLCVQTYQTTSNGKTGLVSHLGPEVLVSPEETVSLEYRVPDTNGAPIATVGISISQPDGRGHGALAGALWLDWLRWSGAPSCRLLGPGLEKGTQSETAWLFSADQHFVQTEGILFSKHWETGFAVQGTADWNNYRASAVITPRLFESGGIVVGYRGLRRFVSCAVSKDSRLEISAHIDGETTVLASSDTGFVWNDELTMDVVFKGAKVEVHTSSGSMVETDKVPPQLQSGAAGLVVTRGSLQCSSFEVSAGS